MPQNPKEKIWKKASVSVRRSVWYPSGSWIDHRPGGWQTEAECWSSPWARTRAVEASPGRSFHLLVEHLLCVGPGAKETTVSKTVEVRLPPASEVCGRWSLAC